MWLCVYLWLRVSCDYKIILLCVLIPRRELAQEIQEGILKTSIYCGIAPSPSVCDNLNTPLWFRLSYA